MSNHTKYTASLSDDWDLELTGDGGLKMLKGDRSVAQNVACECRMFKNDSYMRYDEGVTWFEDILGKSLQKVVIESRLREAAESVDGVASVSSVDIDNVNQKTRHVSGSIEIETIEGENVRAQI